VTCFRSRNSYKGPQRSLQCDLKFWSFKNIAAHGKQWQTGRKANFPADEWQRLRLRYVVLLVAQTGINKKGNDVNNQQQLFRLLIFLIQPYMFRATNSPILRRTF
jgi:hypothetical protein